MDAGEVLALGLGVMPPWRLVSQHLETGKPPHEVHLFLEAGHPQKPLALRRFL